MTDTQHSQRPRIQLEPAEVLRGAPITVRGTGFDPCRVSLRLDGKARPVARVAEGWLDRGGVRASGDGSFLVELSSIDVAPGSYTLEVSGCDSILAKAKVKIQEPKRMRDDAPRPFMTPYWRSREFATRRFAYLGFVPPDVRSTQIESIRALRERRDRGRDKDRPSPPLPGAVNWTPVGANPVPRGQTQGTRRTAVAGRTLAMSIHPTTSTIVLGTATGGVWRSTENGTTWSPRSDFARSMAIATIARDPNNPDRLLAGTGEYNIISGLTYYGNGLLRSTDDGQSWTELATTTFVRDEVTKILFDPTDTTSQRVFLSSATGFYESTDGGANWTQRRAGRATDFVLFVTAGPPVSLRVLVGFDGGGVFQATRSATSWGAWTPVTHPVFPSSFGRIALGQCRDTPNSIYVAFANAGTAGGLSGMARSTDGGTAWTAITGPATGQSWYNFHLAVHPTNPAIVFYGAVNLYRSTTSGASWVDVTDGEMSPPPTDRPIGMHVDQHALIFDPANANTVWAMNDGGVYRSTDLGASWTHRNRDLQTLQYMHLSQHPTWDAVMLAGSQDNGTHRYLGHPAWEHVADGDGGFTAIDPTTPTRMYRGYIYASLNRSTNAGAVGSWVDKSPTTGSFEFYPPFTLDPADPNVCYFGGDRLFRSPDNADTWVEITTAGEFSGNATALAVHPADPDIVFVGTTTGRVYRVERTGTTWTAADVTVTNLSGAPLPSGVYISDLVCDTSGNLWATVASVTWTESTGEFTNDHVFRRAAGTTSWETRSTGLAQANPINTIVIDPTNSSRLFCGGDLGVFRTDDTGLTWTPWDQGLPNCPVFHLAISPTRLLRAATFGRSVWERSIDATTLPMVDLYLRDDVVDVGRANPSPSGVPHPFMPTTNVWWWQSPDIKVDAPQPMGFQTPTPTDDYVVLEGDLQHRSAVRGQTNRFYLQVHNRGVSVASNVRVRAFFADASAGLPALPADFWTGGRPFVGTPSGPAWTPIGPTQSLARLEPAEPGLVVWEWTVQTAAAQHSCLIAVVTCDEDPIDGGGILDVGALVTTRKHVTLKNLHVVDITPGAPLPSPLVVQLNDPRGRGGCQRVEIEWGDLPVGTRLFAALEKRKDVRPLDMEAAERDGFVAAREPGPLHHRLPAPCAGEIEYDLERAVVAERKERASISLPNVQLPKGAPLRLQLNLVVPKELPEGARFTIVQRGERCSVVGGSTYELRLTRDK